MKCIPSEKWILHPGEFSLPDWNDLVPVKENPVRRVLRDSSFFYKMESKNGFWNRVRNVFCSKARSEYGSSLLLKNAGIPCVECVAWGVSADRSSSLFISKAEPGMISGMNFWYLTCAEKPALREPFIQNLCQMIALFREHGLIHPDFHLGNILAEPATGRIVLVDPFGVRRGRFSPVAMCSILAGMRGETDFFNPVRYLLESGAADSELDACDWLKHAVRIQESRARKDWPRRKRQILGGTSKFASLENGVWIRKGICGELPSFEFPLSEPDVLSENDALKIWLDSYFAFFFRRKCFRIPVKMILNGEKSQVFYLKNGNDAFFYGF